MKRFLAILLLIATSLAQAAPQQPMHLQLQKVYTSQIGVTEVPAGSNWGPAVSKYLAAVKVYTPAPWCAAFVHWCHTTAGIKDNINAYSPTATNWNNLVYFKSKFLAEPRAGDVFTIYYAALRRVGHTGFVDKRINPKIFRSAEGNTNVSGSREGVAVQYKYRSFIATHSISRWQ